MGASAPPQVEALWGVRETLGSRAAAAALEKGARLEEASHLLSPSLSPSLTFSRLLPPSTRCAR